MNIRIEPLGGALGAQVTNIDLGRDLAPGTCDALRRGFLDHLVLVFRDQELTPERHVELSRHFGDVDIHVLDQFQLPDTPEVLVLSNRRDAAGRPVGLEEAGRYWHTDVSYTEMPSKASLLYAIVVPPDAGDTLFANMYAAYEALPPDRKERLAGLIAVHGLDRNTAPKFTDAQLAATGDVRHPLIRTHPETGRKAIYAGRFVQRIEGLSEVESVETVTFLSRHCTRPEFQYRHRWRAGDLVMWDNRCVLHRATEFDPALERHLHRTTLLGDTPV